ncbi:MAG: hypothetical protein M3P24_12140 [Gemmatimonadota bacterium]|nr:hypothetical protein [Gemmatimonadota bacterium]
MSIQKIAGSFRMFILAFLLAPVEGHSQAIVPVRGLEFGLLLPGVTARVSVRDAWRRGEVRIEGSGTMEIKLVLPSDLASSTGGGVPLLFQGGDAAIYYPKTGRLTVFDPRQPLRITIPPAHEMVMLYLGGTAAPRSEQAAEVYSAGFVVVVSVTNT